MSEVKSKRGGARPGSGRPKLVVDDEPTVINELIFPALCSAFRSQPDKFRKHYISVDLSKSDIQAVYGKGGVAIWMRWFSLEQLGGRNKDGVPFPSRWSLNLGMYATVKSLVESLGHTLKDLPDPGFPPAKMMERLQALAERRLKLKMAKART